MSLPFTQVLRADAAILRDAQPQNPMGMARATWHSCPMAKTPKTDTKEERLAEALRANLKRRKAQSRGRKVEAKSVPADAKKTPENGAN